jgi:amino acid transporter
MSPEDFTGMLIHMMTKYREQKRIIRAMVVICVLGGLCYVALGALNVGQFLSGIASGNAPQAVLFAIVAAAINLTIGGACILVSTYFRRYAKVWDARLDALARSEDELGRMLERG